MIADFDPDIIGVDAEEIMDLYNALIAERENQTVRQEQREDEGADTDHDDRGRHVPRRGRYECREPAQTGHAPPKLSIALVDHAHHVKPALMPAMRPTNTPFPPAPTDGRLGP